MAYQAIDLATLRLRLQTSYESVPFWTATEADRAINEALWFWNLLTGRWHQTIVLPTTANTVDYALPSTLLYRTRVLFNNRPLSPSSREELNNGRIHWRTETTASGGDVPTRPTLWAPISLGWIYVWPADAVGHNALTVEGVAATPVLTLDTDKVDLAEADLSVLLGYALHAISLKKGGPWFAATLPKFKAFLAAAAEENSLITTSQVYRKVMGLDRRDQKPFKDVPTALANLIGAIQPQP